MPKYKVVGAFAVFGNAPGEEFEADLSAFDEDRLIDGGHIQRAKSAPASKKEAE